MKVVSYQAHNVMKVSDVKFDMEGRHLFLVGGDNGQGKSSALNGLLMALCGRSGMDWPEVALTEGEDEGLVKVELAGDGDQEPVGLSLELRLKRKRGGAVVEEFRLFGADGKPAKEPRELLKRLYRYKGFDPQEFDRLSKADRRKVLMDLCGIDFSGDEAKIKELYTERTMVNREMKAAAGALTQMQRHPDAPDAEVSAADLMTELEEKQRHNDETDGIEQSMQDAVEASQRCQDRIAAEQAEIEAMKAEIARREAMIESHKASAAEWHGKYGELQAKRSIREVKDVEDVKRRIKGAGEVNAKVRANQQHAEAKSNVDRLTARTDDLTKEMYDINEAQHDKLKNAQWPVPGLAIDAAGVLFDGLPYEQASKSQRLLLSTRIGMALNPTLRLLVCQDGGDMGNGTLDALEDLLREEDFQLVLELVTRSQQDEDRCAVVIENGTSRSKQQTVGGKAGMPSMSKRR